MLSRLKARGLLWPVLTLLLALPLLLGLGTWQLQRKAWKDGLQRQIDLRATAAPITWAELDARFKRNENLEYLRVRLEGTFLHATEVYLYWPLPTGPGWLVFTLFKPADGEQTLLVNRGWVPDQLRMPEKRAAGQIEGPSVVIGLIRGPETPNRFTPPNEPANNIWYWRDLVAMRAASTPQPGKPRPDQPIVPPPLDLPFAIDAEAEPANPGGWPKGGATNLRLPNRHLEYAVTWYGLAVTLIGVFLVFARGRLNWRDNAAPGRSGGLE